MRALLTRIAAWVVERPAPVVALAILLSLVGAVGALSLQADRNPDSLVDSGSDTFAATEEFYEEFGDEPVQILIEGDLQRLMLSEDLGRILALEGCLAGSDQDGTKGEVFGEGEPTPAACTRLAEERPAEVVFGPATFLNQTAITAEKLLRDQTQAAEEQAAAAARQAANAAVAELGSMRISDEIDALEVMGVQPMIYLCATRLMGAWLTLPFIYLAGIGVGYFASYLAVVEQVGEVSSGGYFLIFWMFQNPPDLIFSLTKGMVMATAIVLVGCYYGYNAAGGPVGVGTATAKSMVLNIVLVHVIGMMGTLIFWGANPRAPIGG